MNAHCDLCNGLYGMRHPTQRFCGSKCRKKMQRVLEDRRGERVAAKRMRSVPPRPALAQEYRAACLCCGRSGEGTMLLTQLEAEALRSFPRCAHCGGRVLLEQVLLTTGRSA